MATASVVQNNTQGDLNIEVPNVKFQIIRIYPNRFS